MATDALEIALDRKISPIDADARDQGHVPQTWSTGEDDGDLIACTRCTRCDADAAVRVRPDGSSWAAGRMRLQPCIEEAT